MRSTQYGRPAGHGYRYRVFTAITGLCALLATALSLTACGGSDDEQTVPATNAEASANEQAVAAEHAVTLQNRVDQGLCEQEVAATACSP